MKNKPNYIVGLFLVVFGIALGVVGTSVVYVFTNHTKVVQNYNEEDYLVDILKEYSYYYKDDAQLFNGALNGIMESLGDPYSVYFSEDEYNSFNKDINNDNTGAGINLKINGPYPIITNVLMGSPASIAGLKEGQTIVSINSNDLKNKTYDEIYKIIAGEEGDNRSFTVYEDDPLEHKEITLKLGHLDTYTVSYNVVYKDNQKIGYLAINSFSQTTYEEFKISMNRLEEKQIDHLIVDVRGNPGGLLSSVSDILDYFLNTDEPFMYEQAKNQEKVAYYLTKDKRNISYDVAVLIDEGSASAAEVFAQAMNEIGGYPLIGQTTFGKGTVQIVAPLNSEETKNIKLTTDRWLTSSGKWIHGVGIKPSIEVELSNFYDLSFIDASVDISYDHVNTEIKDVENFLYRLGYTTRTDGYFDQGTKEAVEKYQQDKALDVTGKVDFKTAYIMNQDLIHYIQDLDHDNQYQKALEYVTD